MSSIRLAYVNQNTAVSWDEGKKTSMRLAFDANNPVDLLEQLIALLNKEQLYTARREAERIREIVKQSWENRSTVVTWDWKPAARHIKEWIEKTLDDTPINVWMVKRPGDNIELNFQMRSQQFSNRWNQSKFKTLRGQLGRKFEMTPHDARESLYTLPDGQRVEVHIFTGGTPTGERLA